MRSDDMVRLVRAACSGNVEGVRTAAKVIACHERSIGHEAIAEQIEKAAGESPYGSISEGVPGLLVENPQDRFMYSEETSEVLYQLMAERGGYQKLIDTGLQPANKLLLYGPPGNGKTTFAHAVAKNVGLPIMCVRYSQLINSHLGETAKALSKAFDFARRTPCVLFFDEFDSIGTSRGTDSTDVAEMRRVVNSLVMEMDSLKAYSYLVAATNMDSMIDGAVLRRFEVRLEFPQPKPERMREYIDFRLGELHKGGVNIDVDGVKAVLSASVGRSYSDAELAINAAAKACVLGTFSDRAVKRSCPWMEECGNNHGKQQWES